MSDLPRKLFAGGVTGALLGASGTALMLCLKQPKLARLAGVKMVASAALATVGAVLGSRST